VKVRLKRSRKPKRNKYMISIEHDKLKIEALKKLNALINAFATYCNSLVIDKSDFDTSKEFTDFENNSREGIEYRTAIANLRKFEQERNL
jgi:hypothetical protein